MGLFGLGSDGPDGRVVQSNAYIDFNYRAARERELIQNAQGIDSTSRQEIIDQLDSGASEIGRTNTSNSDTYGEIVSKYILQAQQAILAAQGDSPVYVERRFLQHLTELQQDQPGRKQTVLTQRDYTPSGTPTLTGNGNR